MIISLRELFSAINITEAPFSHNRVVNMLEELSEMFGEDNPKISLHEIPLLKERFREFLKTTDAKPATIRNKVYRLSFLIELATEQGLLPKHEGIPLPPRPKHEGPDRRRYNALRSFDDWLYLNNISVRAVSDQTFRVYRDEIKAKGNTLAEDRYNCAVKSWRELASQGVVHKLDLPRWKDESREEYGLPRSSWPARVAADFERFCQAATGRARPGDKRRRLLRSESIYDIERELCRLLGYLVNIHGMEIENSNLVQLIGDRETVIGYISWHIAKRCEGTERKHHVETLDWFARLLEWFEGDQDVAAEYRLIAKSLKPVRARDPFPERPITYEEFSTAAQQALEKAELDWKAHAQKNRRTQAAVSAAIACRDALLFAFLVCRPMRSRNMREMKLGTNLYKSGDEWRLRFSDEEMKSKEYNCAFPKVLVSHLEYYLNGVRPFFVQGCGKELFLTKSGRGIGRSDFWKIMTKAGRRIMGLETNPHLFRYLISSAYLLRHPDRALEIQALLGHAVLETTLRYYVHTYSRIASQRAADVLRKNCPSMLELGTLFPPST